MTKEIIIQIQGIHCRSCKVLIESQVKALPGVTDIKVNDQSGETQISYDENQISAQTIFATIEKLNYKVGPNQGQNGQSPAEPKQQSSGKRLLFAGLIILALVGGYFLVQRLGLLRTLALLNEGNVSWGLIFAIGLLASFHCVGMCGGLVITYTAHQAARASDQPSRYTPHLLYNLGRFLSYTIIGAILGGIGSFFAISPRFTGTITLLAGIFMVVMGLSLLTRLKIFEKIKPRLPAGLARIFVENPANHKPKGPFLIGLLNGLMPCGPLQAMQLYALTTGSFWKGGLAMALYVAGTIPALFGLGSIVALLSQTRVKRMMQVSGALVIVLGIFMFSRGLANFGPGFPAPKNDPQTVLNNTTQNSPAQNVQTVTMRVTYQGYLPNILYVQKGVPVRWIIQGDQITGCTNTILMPAYNIRKKLKAGENVIEFTPTQTGEVPFSCGMQMVWGKFIITEDQSNPAALSTPQRNESLNPNIQAAPPGGCGGGASCGCGARLQTN